MVLATVIRLEFAYPGVGIFAGDSLQYLSMVTAHGVIMVFFMIMPLLLGAFGNFLLPTQLGVHDVAFPRLNSAAFWFLPAGLLMLCQLVCTDRRYQRMNCFNIREIQTLLKQRFFQDLINFNDHRFDVNKTLIGLRYKLNNSSTLPNYNLFSYYGVNFLIKNRFNLFNNNNNENYLLNNIFYLFINKLDSFSILYYLNFFYIQIFQFFFFLLNPQIQIFNIIFFQLNFLFNFIKYIFNWGYKTLIIIVKNIIYLFNDEIFLILNTIINYFNYFNLIQIYNNFQLINYLNHINLNFNYKFFFFLQFKELFNSNVFISFFNFFSVNLEFLFIFLDSILTIFKFNIILSFINWFEEEFWYWFIESLADLVEHDVHMHITALNIKFQFFYNIKILILNILNFNFLFFFYIKFILNYFYILILLINENFFFFFIFIYEFFYFLIFKTSIYEFNLYKNLLIETSLIGLIFFFFNNIFFYFFYFKTLIYINYFNIFQFFFILIEYNINNLLIQFSLFKKNLTLNNFYFLILLNKKIDQLISSNQSNFFFMIKFNTYLSLIDIIKIPYMLFTIIIFFNNLIFFFFYYLIKEFNYLLINIINFFFYIIYKISYNILFIYINNIKIYFNFNNFFFYINNINFNYTYISDFFLNYSYKFLKLVYYNESEFNFRQLNNNNLNFKYDFVAGNYLGKNEIDRFPYMFTSIIQITSGARQPIWFLSNNFNELFLKNYNFLMKNFIFIKKITNFSNLSLNSNFYKYKLNKYNLSSIDWFFYITNLFNKDFNLINNRWIDYNVFNQKFYKFYLTSSLQSRIYSNWRQLKFTREAWRCKLLIARHQKTLYKRYVHEDNVIWSIERNAKDLLPGWAMITPFSSRIKYTITGKVDIGLMGVLFVLTASIISSANFLVTYRYLSTLNNRKMRDARAFFSEGLIIASGMIIAANPMLIIGIIMLLSDRHWQTSFFDYSGGGDTVLFQHMFWFFGHPEVYIIMIPVFGFTNTILSFFLRKRVSARTSLLYSMYTIAFLGFFVWGHHMYMVGLAHTTRMLFSTLTVMIAVPAATKLMHWCVTIVNSSFHFELPLLFIFTFIFFFVSGGISGMCVAHTGMDILFHDTFYVIGHFHVMLAGSGMSGSFGAFYFYFPAIFGVKYSRIYAYLHYIYYIIGQMSTVIPMFWLGYAGMPRRVLDYPLAMGGWHSFISAGHLIAVAGLISFFIMIFDSLRQSRAVIRNNFGIGRYNTRINFYIYESSKLIHLRLKGWSLLRLFGIKKLISRKNNQINKNFENFEIVLYSYIFIKKS